MDRTLFRVIGFTLAGLSALLFTSACGGDDVTCGDNTIADNGKCVANTSKTRSCGAGTTVNEDGQCVISADGCSDAASFDSDKNRCVPGSSTCAEGTEFNAETGTCVGVIACGPDTVQNDDGSCVADVGTLCASQPGVTYDPESGNCRVGTSACGPGTQLSAESGTCVISDASCGTGLMINDQGNCVPTDQVCGDQSTLAQVDGSSVCVPDASCKSDDVVLMTSNSTQGICVSPAEELAHNPDIQEREGPQSSTNNDPNYEDSTLRGLAVQPPGNTTAAVGTIGEPKDLDGDGSPDQDIDGFKFNADAGQWFSVSVQSLGLPQPWFRITGPDGFERTAAVGLESDPARQILIPYTGEYTIEVMPTAAATTDSSKNGPYGNKDWKYVLGFEQLSAPSPSDNDFSNSNVSGSLAKLTDNIYSINGFNAGDFVEVKANNIGSGATGVIQLWRDANTLIKTTEVSSGQSVILSYPDASAPLLVMDWKTATGSDLSYEVSAEVSSNLENLGNIAPGSSASSTPRTIADEDQYFYAFDIQGGQVVELSHTNDDDENVEVEASLAEGAEFYDEFSLPPSNDIQSYENDEGYFYVDKAATILLTATADDGELPNFELTVESSTPKSTVNNLQAGDQLVQNVDATAPKNRSEFLQFSLNDPAEVIGELKKLQPANTSVDFEVDVYRADQTKELGFNYEFEVDSSGDVADIVDDSDFLERALSKGKYLIAVRVEDPPLDRYRIDFTMRDYFRESEPNDSQATADDFPIGEVGVASAKQGNDDYFNVTLNSGIGPNEYVTFTAEGQDYTYDGWECKVLDSAGNTVSEYTGHGDDGCKTFLSDVGPGTYTFQTVNNDDDTDYLVDITTPQPGILEVEPNDDRTNNATGISYGDLQGGMPLVGDALSGATEGDVDFFKITSSGGSVSEFDLNCDQIGLDPNTGYCFFGFCFGGMHYTLLDSSGSDIDSGEHKTDYTLNSGTISSSDLPLYLKIENGDQYDDNQYKCTYESP